VNRKYDPLGNRARCRLRMKHESKKLALHTRRRERLHAIRNLHHCAFRHQWKADNKPDGEMEAAFLAQQKQMAARKIRVSIRFVNGNSTPLHEILNNDTDTLLAAIYVKGLVIEKVT
jgi:hypothetical protein